MKFIIVRSLYGLKSAAAAFRNYLAHFMEHSMGYKPCCADPDLWYKAEVRPEDGYEYYAYILLYIDDCLVCHHDAMGELKKIDACGFQMKP